MRLRDEDLIAVSDRLAEYEWQLKNMPHDENGRAIVNEYDDTERQEWNLLSDKWDKCVRVLNYAGFDIGKWAKRFAKRDAFT